MAKLEQGVLGPFRGKVGPVVGYTWRGRHVVRAYRREINYPNTECQRRERDWFVSMVRFAAMARPALLAGLGALAAGWRMTEGNAFVKVNKGCFGRDGAVDYGRLSLSSGSAAPVVLTAASLSADNVLEVSFESVSRHTRASGSDRVHLYVYDAVGGEGLLVEAVERRRRVLRAVLPAHWDASSLHLYAFVVDRAGRASATSYLAVGEPDATVAQPPLEHHSVQPAARSADVEAQTCVAGEPSAEVGPPKRE